MNRIDGKSLAAQVRAETATRVRALPTPPTLAVLLVGNDPASRLYVELKEKAATDIGIRTRIVREDHLSDEQIISLIESWNADPAIDAILVQLPLPPGHDDARIISTIAPEKDADGFHPLNREKLLRGESQTFPPLHEGILRLIASTNIQLNGTKTVLIGNSGEFLDPLKYLLTRVGCFVETMNPDDLNRRALREAQIVVIAVGRPNFLTSAMIGKDVVIIDVGTNRNANGTTCGDVDAESMEPISGWLTPVPGGVGPMTVAMLFANVVHLHDLAHH